MSKAAEAPCPLLLLIWLRNFKCSKERRKQTALVGSRSNWCQSPFPTDLTLWQRRPQQSDGLWCRCGAWSWLCRRPSRSCWSCWPAVEPGPERRHHYHHHNIIKIIIIIMISRARACASMSSSLSSPWYCHINTQNTLHNRYNHDHYCGQRRAWMKAKMPTQNT